MDQMTARRRLAKGEYTLKQGLPQRTLERDFMNGNHVKPFLPPGVSKEYLELREYSISNMLPLAQAAPLQRLKVSGFSTHGKDSASQELDSKLWRNTWQFNRMDARQKIVYADAYNHGRGIVSVAAASTVGKARISIESPDKVHVEMDPEDPFKPLYAVKIITDESEMETGAGIILPNGETYHPGSTIRKAWVYDDKGWMHFKTSGQSSAWVYVSEGDHSMDAVPFVPYDVNLDSSGKPHSILAQLLPTQKAINFVRFATLLALQFSAHRQRAISGYDPVVRTEEDEIVYQKDKNGVEIMDPLTGLRVPVLESLGRMGVDRLVTFANKDVKVWDMPESNLENYINVHNSLIEELFARAQIPPQYQLINMHNLTGDALSGAESTLTSFVGDLKATFSESHEQVMRLAARAVGHDGIDDYSSEIAWGDGETRSFGQIIDAITKLISVGFPKKAAFAMIPGATDTKVNTWMDMSKAELHTQWAIMEGQTEELDEDLSEA